MAKTPEAIAALRSRAGRSHRGREGFGSWRSRVPHPAHCLFAAMAIAAGAQPGETEGSAGELHVIASESVGVEEFVSPGHFPSVLYRVEDGALVQVRVITTSLQGSLFTRVFHDKGWVLVGSEGWRPGSILLDVLDMRALGKERSLDLDFRDDCVYLGAHLLNRPEGLVFLVHAVATEKTPSLLPSWGGVPALKGREMSAGWFFLQLRPPSLRLEEVESSFLGVDLARGRVMGNPDYGWLRDAYTYGPSGGLAEGEDYLYPVHEQGGEAELRLGPAAYPLGWQLPPPLRLSAEDGRSVNGSLAQEGPEQPASPPVTVQVAHNDWLRALADAPLGADRKPARAFHVFDGKSQTWSRIVLAGKLFQMRAYGPWLAFEEHYYRENLREWKRSPEYERLDGQRAPYTPQANFHLDFFPSTAERLSQTATAPAGRLHLYHAHRQRHVTHHTGEPNSEVLYVDAQDRVYYRVNDELRTARVVENGFADIVVLARHPVIFAVHHLFFGKR